jgi:Zn-dependent peptidase ImmA (M78 family)
MMPGDKVLIAVADVLNKPLDFFFQPFSVELSGVQFRKKMRLPAKLEDSIKEQALDFFERYIEIEQVLGLPNKFKSPLAGISVTEPAQAESAAEKVRDAWKLGRDSLPNVFEMLDSNGIKSLAVDAPDSFDGFSGWADGHPIVVVGNWLDRDLPRKRFTTLHEIAHILIHPNDVIERKEREKCCHRFAGAMLMPRKAFETAWGGYRRHISLKELKDLKRRWGMSIAAIMRRASDLDLLDPQLYQRFLVTSRSKGWHRKEPGDYLGVEVSHRFEQLVLRAAGENLITMSKAAALLNQPQAELRGLLSDFA